jgi:hypothetical protein
MWDPLQSVVGEPLSTKETMGHTFALEMTLNLLNKVPYFTAAIQVLKAQRKVCPIRLGPYD